MLQDLVSPYYMLRIKHGERLRATLALLEFQREHVAPKLYARNMHDLRLAHEASNMLLDCEMRLRAGLSRQVAGASAQLGIAARPRLKLDDRKIEKALSVRCRQPRR